MYVDHVSNSALFSHIFTLNCTPEKTCHVENTISWVVAHVAHIDHVAHFRESIHCISDPENQYATASWYADNQVDQVAHVVGKGYLAVGQFTLENTDQLKFHEQPHKNHFSVIIQSYGFHRLLPAQRTIADHKFTQSQVKFE